MLSAPGNHPVVPEFTWWLLATQKIWRLLCVSNATPLDRGPNHWPHWPREAAILRIPTSSLYAEGLPESSLQPEDGLEAGPALGAGKEAGSCSVVPEEKLLSDGMLVEAREASEEDLLVVHTRRYLNELKVQYRDLWAVAGSSGRRRSSSALGVPTPVPSTGEVLKMKRGQ